MRAAAVRSACKAPASHAPIPARMATDTSLIMSPALDATMVAPRMESDPLAVWICEG